MPGRGANRNLDRSTEDPSMPQPSPNPVVLITGASRGIGAAAAIAFARAGWRVAITARTQHEGQALDHQLRRPDGGLMGGSLSSTAAAVREAGAEVFSHPMDLMDPGSAGA
jgi:NAD(P)-dependent dehydrogenase (short-subunit alcohol dehydrogenase family)